MRAISWVRAAFTEVTSFPQAVQEQIKFALEVAAAGQMADIAKPMKGLDGGVYEIALPQREIEIIRERLKRIKEL